MRTALILVLLIAAPAQAATADLWAGDIESPAAFTNGRFHAGEWDGADSQPLAVSAESTSGSIYAWYVDSGGTPVPTSEPSTEIRLLHDGDFRIAGLSSSASFVAQVLAPAGAPFSGEDLRMVPHDEPTIEFADYVPATGQEVDVDVSFATRIDSSAGVWEIDAPATLVLWGITLDYVVDGESYSTWSGERAHNGNEIAGRFPEGLDRQLLVLHLEEGTIRVNVYEFPPTRAYASFQDAEFHGGLELQNAWNPITENRSDAGPETIPGPLLANISLIDNATLSASTRPLEQAPSVTNGSIATPGLPIEPAPGNPDPEAIVSSPEPRANTLILAALGVLAAIAAFLGLRVMRWQHVKTRFNRGDYRYVAKAAGGHHNSGRIGDLAQVMSMTSMLKLDQPEFVLDHLPRMNRIEPGIAAILQAHALLALGRNEEAEAIQIQDSNGPGGFSSAIDWNPPDAAYT